MEESDIGELIDEAVEGWGGELEAVEIDGGECDGGEIVRRVFAVEALVSAYIRPDPCFCDSEWVGSDYVFEILNYWENQGESLV